MKRLFSFFFALLLICLAACKKEPADPTPAPVPDPVQPEKPEFGVYGKVTCNGQPVADVVVSDGFKMTKTLTNGSYSLSCDKKNSYVFIEVPSGYKVKSNGVQPEFFKKLHDIIDVEQVDFELFEEPGQEHHKILFLGDFHLANSSNTKDLRQFDTFTDEINKYVQAHKSDVIYAITLGDMTWDFYWYSNSFMLDRYLVEINSRVKDLTFYHTIGNHDHDYRTSVSGETQGWEAVDWDCAKRYRGNMGPNNYAFNIGAVHYIVLDNILCKNTTGGTTDDRFYDATLSSEAMSFLRQDLQYVSHDTPIIIASHSQYYSQTGGSAVTNLDEFEKILSPYSDVRLVTGHSHKIWNFRKGNLYEHNSGSVCAAWWWGGYYTPTLNIAQDGSLGGYRIMDIDGTEMTSFFKTVGRDDDYQFRSYDRNDIEITSERYLPSAMSSTRKTFDEYVAKYSSRYDKKSTANEVIVNIWDWDEGWSLEVTENGKNLPASKLSSYDPLFFVVYTAQRCKENKDIAYNPSKTNHLFKVSASAPDTTLEITVTDDEGRSYHETMQRPKSFTIDQYD